MNEFERTISELESLYVDPVLGELISESKDVNELVSAQPITDIESQALVIDLNARWRDAGFYNKKMFVTGTTMVGGNIHDVDHVFENGINTGTDFVNKAFQARGFTMRNTITETNQGIAVRQQLLLRGRMEIKSKSGVDGIENEECGIVLDANTMIECREKTPAKVAAWMEVYHPEAKAEIDYSVVEAKNESQATMALRELTLPMQGYGKKELKQQKSYIETYLNAVNRYDLHVPYVVELLGDCQIFGDGGFKDQVITSEHKTLVLLSDLFLRPDEVTRTFKVCVSGSLIGNNKSKIDVMNMPLETIMSIESMRAAYRIK